jgi:hypothetical protein
MGLIKSQKCPLYFFSVPKRMFKFRIVDKNEHIFVQSRRKKRSYATHYSTFLATVLKRVSQNLTGFPTKPLVFNTLYKEKNTQELM